MDPFSWTTGVVGLLVVVAQVTEAVNFYIGAIKDRKQEIQDLYQELILLRGVLTQLQEFIATEKAKDASFDSNSVLATAITDCSLRLERVGNKLKIPTGDRLSKTIAKLKWPLEQEEIKKLSVSLQRFIQTFSFALTVQGLTVLGRTSDAAEAALKESQTAVQTMLDMSNKFGIPATEQQKMSIQLAEILALLPTLGQQASEIKEMSQHLKLAEEREQARQKAEILEWLVPAATLQKHVKTQQQRVDKTCQWFLDSSEFQKWQNLFEPAYDMLCTGNPGVGKTVLASFVFDHLRSSFKNQNIVVLNHYCSHFEEDSRSPAYLVKSLLRQTCQSLARLPTALTEFYQRTRHDLEDILWSQEVQSILNRIIATCDDVFIILDAVDEVENPRQRNALLSIIKELRSTNPKIRVLATTRPHLSDMYSAFNLPAIINISAQRTDIERMLVQRLEDHPDFELFDDNLLKHEVLTALSSGSSGNFLLPSLQLDHILEQVTKSNVRQALANLSQTLDDAFKTSLDRIGARPPARRTLAFRTMMWISHAKRPIEIAELQHALAASDLKFGTDLDQDDIVPARTILESCSGLVQIQERTVTFVHYSLDEYLAAKASSILLETVGDCDAHIVRTCFAYLMQPEIKKLSFMNTENFTRAIEALSFLRYAASTWGIHARQIDVEAYSDLAISLFDSSMHLITISRVGEFEFPGAKKWQTEAASWAYSNGAGISIAAGFGLPALVQLLINRCQDISVINRCRNRYGNTALQDAAGWGHTEVCRVLVSNGADLLNQNKVGATAFYQAVTYQRLETARELLQHHRGQLDVRCRNGWTALHKAADLGDEDMTKFLLSSGALFAISNEAQMTPLHLAANRGHANIVRLLVLAGADLNMKGHSTKYTPLCLASTCGHTEVVRYLLIQGGLVNNKGADSWTPLFRAARGGHADSVKLLLEGGAHVLHVDYYKNTCLHVAVRSGNLDVVKTLLDHNDDIRPQLLIEKDAKHRTAQQIALTTAHIGTYKYLRDLQHDMDVKAGKDMQRYDPTVPLSLAIEAADLATVKTIIASEPDLLNRPDTSGQLPIHIAFIECATQIAQFLLDSGASIHAQGFHSWQPLHIAASIGSIEMTNLALDRGAEINALTGTLQTPLLKASSTSSVEVIRRLLEAGADPWARNDRQMTCLHVAASKNFIDCIREILQPEWGAQALVHTRDKQKRLPRYWAARSGHHEVERFLRIQEKFVDNTVRQHRRPSRSPSLTRANTGTSQSSRPSMTSPSRTPTKFMESNDILTQMVLDVDSDREN